MASILRASFHGLRCARLALPPSREFRPELSHVVRSWHGESAALEETCTSTETANDTTRAPVAATNEGVDLSKVTREMEKGEASNTTSAANDVNKHEGTAEKSSASLDTDKLTSLILGKMRDQNNTNGQKVPESQPQAKNVVVEERKAVKNDKWDEVMSSLKKMAANKSQGKLALGGDMPSLPKSKESDDFADLDLPQGGGESGSVKNLNNLDKFSRSAMDTFKTFTPNYKQKNGAFQGLSNKQKDNGLQGLNNKPSNGGFEGLNNKQSSSGFQGLSNKQKDNALQGLNNKPSNGGFEGLNNKPSNGGFEGLNNKQSCSGFQGLKLEKSKELKPVSFSFLDLKQENSVKEESPQVSSSNIKAKGATPALEWQASGVKKEISQLYTNSIKLPVSGYTVCIKNLPSQSNLALVKEALSIHGEVLSSFKEPNASGFCDAYIEFKTAEAVDSALESRRLQLDSRVFSIVKTDPPITTVVRLSKVSAETTENQIFSICEKFGGVDNINRRKSGVFDVFYKVNELTNMPKILDSLNEVTLNQRRLLALPAPRLHPLVRKEVLNSTEGQVWHAYQTSRILSKIEGMLDMVCILFQDLRTLNAMENEVTKM